MAHTKAKGSSKLGRDSAAQRLGVKIFGGSFAQAGSIIVRQRGSKYYAGEYIGRGKDDTLFALRSGIVHYFDKIVKKYNGNTQKVKAITIIDAQKVEKK